MTESKSSIRLRHTYYRYEEEVGEHAEVEVRDEGIEDLLPLFVRYMRREQRRYLTAGTIDNAELHDGMYTQTLPLQGTAPVDGEKVFISFNYETPYELTKIDEASTSTETVYGYNCNASGAIDPETVAYMIAVNPSSLTVTVGSTFEFASGVFCEVYSEPAVPTYYSAWDLDHISNALNDNRPVLASLELDNKTLYLQLTKFDGNAPSCVYSGSDGDTIYTLVHITTSGTESATLRSARQGTFVATYTLSETEQGFAATCDKSYAEILAAFASTEPVVIKFQIGQTSDVFAADNTIVATVTIWNGTDVTYITIVHRQDNTITVVSKLS